MISKKRLIFDEAGLFYQTCWGKQLTFLWEDVVSIQLLFRYWGMKIHTTHLCQTVTFFGLDQKSILDFRIGLLQQLLDKQIPIC
ncbi:MAG: hypothetical protein AAF490_26530 [Chloroflexota bacterium]